MECRINRVWVVWLVVLGWLLGKAVAEGAENVPDLLRSLRTNVPTWSDTQFQTAVEEALLQRFGASWVVGETNVDHGAESSTDPVIARVTTYDTYFPYVRLNRVDGDTAGALANQWEGESTNQVVRGRVLDLRFSSGKRLEDATSVLGLWLPEGGGKRRTPAQKTNSMEPLVVLVNGATTGAAEVLAGALQDARLALVIGGTTAGQAGRFQTNILPDGRRYRFPAAQTGLHLGGKVGAVGVKPDIEVVSRLEHDRAWLEDPYSAIVSSTNSPTATNKIVNRVNVRRRVNEAELVRARKENPGGEVVGSTPVPAPEVSTPGAIRDPVLGRALDLLKGLHVLQAKPDVAKP